MAIIALGAFTLALIPMDYQTRSGISSEEVKAFREAFSQPHNTFTSSDGEILFLRRWNPDSLIDNHTAVLILHGVTAHSGPYAPAGRMFSSVGFSTFALDYRGHGLSDGKRGDYSGRDRWVADISEAVTYIKSLGFDKVVLLGHSLGVAAALYTTRSHPDEISGLILLSGAYRGREGVRKSPTFLQRIQILSSSVFRPSYPIIEYYREGMTGMDDPLFNFRYTLRFLQMLDINELQLPADLNIPVLVAIGDKDELFTVQATREVFDDIPGNKKKFLVLPETYHARIPDPSWSALGEWLTSVYNGNYGEN